jgi:pyruvate/2-oxoglutarate dehydrogenase complex dihydrolipoamide acyltransferase (E2) component
VSAVEDIRIKLENRLIVVEQEIESLRCALTALDHEQAASASQAEAAGAGTAAAPVPPPRRRATRRRTAATADGADHASSAELERLLAETGGLTAVELARQTGTDYGVVLARIRQLEEAGRSRR